MQRRALWFGSVFSAVAALGAGCNDLGTCDDPLNGRTPVKVGSDIMYAGQAIINGSCAGGICHASTAKGETRQGAPQGLDFDLFPAPAGAPIMADGGIVGVQLNNLDVAGLRSRQRKVFDERELIWQQVDKGLMPPTDAFKAAVGNILKFMFGADNSSCPAGPGLGTFDQAGKEELRKWLACGTPIVETNSSSLPFVPVPQTSDAGAPEKALGALAYAGAVGYQIPACGPGGGGDGGPEPTFDQVYNNVLLKGSYACMGCHNSAPIGGVDLTTSADIAYRNLLGDGQGATPICATATTVQVKPGDPAGSFFYTKLGGGGTLCGTLMPPPPSPQISAEDLELVRRWIAAGAMR